MCVVFASGPLVSLIPDLAAFFKTIGKFLIFNCSSRYLSKLVYGKAFDYSALMI